MPAFSTALVALTSTLATAGTTAAAAVGGTAAAGTAAAGAGAATTLGGAIGTIGTIGALGSTGMQLYYGQQAAAASQEAEMLRKQQMELEANRARRQAIRDSMMAYYTGINNEASSGATVGNDTSTYGGLLGQTSGNLAYNINAIDQNERIGGALFDVNASRANASGMADLFGGSNKLFNQLANPTNAFALGRVGTAGIPSIFSRT